MTNSAFYAAKVLKKNGLGVITRYRSDTPFFEIYKIETGEKQIRELISENEIIELANKLEADEPRPTPMRAPIIVASIAAAFLATASPVQAFELQAVEREAANGAAYSLPITIQGAGKASTPLEIGVEESAAVDPLREALVSLLAVGVLVALQYAAGTGSAQ